MFLAEIMSCYVPGLFKFPLNLCSESLMSYLHSFPGKRKTMPFLEKIGAVTQRHEQGGIHGTVQEMSGICVHYVVSIPLWRYPLFMSSLCLLFSQYLKAGYLRKSAYSTMLFQLVLVLGCSPVPVLLLQPSVLRLDTEVVSHVIQFQNLP